MVVGAQSGVRRDAGQVVLLVVGSRILAPRPLGDRPGGIDAASHDRRPDAVAVVVARGCRAVVQQPERVARLVRHRLGNGLGRPATGARGEHERRAVLGFVERIEQGDSERAGTHPVRRADHHALAVRGIARPSLAQAVVAGISRRDVDVEREVVLGDALPHLEDQRLLRCREARGAVDVERRGCDDRRRTDGGPRSVDRHVAVEVEIDDTGRGRLRLEREHVDVQRCRRERRRHDGVGEWQCFGVAQRAVVGQEQRRVVDEFLDQLVGLDARLRGDIVELTARDQIVDSILALQDIEIGPGKGIDVDCHARCRAGALGRLVVDRPLVGGMCGRPGQGRQRHRERDGDRITATRRRVLRASVQPPPVDCHHVKVPLGGRRAASRLGQRRCRDRRSIPAPFGLLGLNASRPPVTSGVRPQM